MIELSLKRIKIYSLGDIICDKIVKIRFQNVKVIRFLPNHMRYNHLRRLWRGKANKDILRVENINTKCMVLKVQKQYMALKNIALKVNEGEFIGVMDLPGSGKPPVLNILGSIDKPTTGELIMDGRDIPQV